MSKLINEHTSSFVNSKHTNLIRQIFLNIDSIPSDFFPSLTNIITEAEFILDKYKIKSFSEALALGEDFKILWILLYVNKDRVSLATAASVLSGLINDTLTGFVAAAADSRINYTNGGIDYSHASRDLPAEFNKQIANLEFIIDREALDPVWLPLTVRDYFSFGYGWSQSGTPVVNPLTSSNTGVLARNVANSSNDEALAAIRLSTFVARLAADLEKLRDAGALRNYQDTIDYYASLAESEVVSTTFDYEQINVTSAITEIGNAYNTISQIINNPTSLLRIMWLFISAIVFGWKPIEQWFIDYNVWSTIPEQYRGPLPRFNEYITKVFNGAPYSGSRDTTGKTMAQGNKRKNKGPRKNRPPRKPNKTNNTEC